MKMYVKMLLVILSCSLCFAGSLQPTAAPAPTMKPLSAIEPRMPVQGLSGSATSMFVITEPGSYYMTGNINADPNKNGIEIICSNVTVDLKGFTITGAGKSVGTIGTGIYADDVNQITIQNGFISQFRGNGIDNQSGTNLTAENMVVENCFSSGIRGGSNCAVRNCKCCNNSSTGVSVGSGSTVTDCTTNSNLNGISAWSDGCTISNNTVYNNSFGISACFQSYIHHNNINNSTTGIMTYYDYNVIEYNIVTYCVVGLDLGENQNLYLNNRLGGNVIDYQTESGNTDGGGNIEF